MLSHGKSHGIFEGRHITYLVPIYIGFPWDICDPMGHRMERHGVPRDLGWENPTIATPDNNVVGPIMWQIERKKLGFVSG